MPSVVSLGVLVGPGDDERNHVVCAGGFSLQLMPGATEELISVLEERVNKIASVTTLLKEGKTIKEIIGELLEGYDVTDETETECGYNCSCSKEKMEKALVSLGRGELEEIISTTGEAELTCQFCRTSHKFDKNELEKILEEI